MTTTALQQPAPFLRPTAIERFFNRVLGVLVERGWGAPHFRQLEVRGRRSGKRYRTPVNLMEHDGREWLVAPRGRTAWVKNAEAAGEVELLRGQQRTRYALREVVVAERVPLLREYLRRYRRTVARYFSVTLDDRDEAFLEVASRHPVFELVELGSEPLV